MKTLKNKIAAITIVIFFILSMTASMSLIPNANAHSPPWTIKSYAYLTVAPGTVGVGQQVQIYMFVDHAMPSAAIGNSIRRAGYTLTMTAPDGTVSTKTWTIVNDPTGIQSYMFYPSQVGNYTFVFNYPGQTYIWSGTYQNDTFTASTTATKTLIVQQTPIPAEITPSLPSAYWTYPIFGENWNWYTIASNWLSGPFTPAFGSHSGSIQPFGSGPNTSHIMWSSPIQYGGVVGGNATNVQGEMYYQGGSYNTRFSNAIIIQGTLFFQLPYGNSGSGGNYVAWDLKTGKQLWSINASATGVSLVPSFGYVYSYDSPNQHGNVPDGLLIATQTVTSLGTVWRAYDPMTGVLTTMNVTNVPGGSNIAGPAGEYLKYVLTNYGTTTNPNWYLAQWNSSKVFSTQNSGTFNASLASDYDWNVSLNLGPGTWSIGSGPLIAYNNIALLTQGAFGTRSTGSTDPANITAISLKPGSLGSVLWKQSYPVAPGNATRVLSAWDPTTGVFVFWDQELMDQIGYSLSTGQLLWGPVTVPNGPNTDWNYMGDSATQENIAYGNLYWASYTGQLYCFDDTTGALKWTFGNGGEDNSTAAPWLPYGYTPVIIGAIADGKIYLTSSEHSPNSPLYPNYDLRCINATTGLQMWAMPSFANLMYGGYTPIASGYIVTDNTYDQQIYCYGQGPSTMTVTAPDTAAPLGTPVVIRGTVTDISAGTKQDEQALNFPNGVPCASDASQSAWMQYVYEQQSKPTDATGVPVTLSVIDSNGNHRNIGTTTSDASGTFAFTWTPDITGNYIVIATFAGSQSYYGTSAETYFYASSPSPTASPYPVVNLPPTEMYVIGVGVAIIIAIAIVGALMLIAIKKRP